MVASDESGQSVMEFMLLMPLMFGLVVLTVRVNTAMQISIVNQQYARAHALFLAFNSSIFPEKKYRGVQVGNVGFNQMVIGVSENRPDEESGGQYIPEATSQMISRSRRLAGADGPSQSETSPRGYVHVRDTVGICTQSNFIRANGALMSIDPTTLSRLEGVTSPPFDYCGSPLDE